MVSKKVNNFFIGLAACKYLIILGVIIWFIVSRFQVVFLPVGGERYYPRTSISDEAIERTRPVLYVNPVSTGEKLESSLSFFELMVKDTEVKAKQPGIKVMNIYHDGSEDERARSIYYVFVVYEL